MHNSNCSLHVCRDMKMNLMYTKVSIDICKHMCMDMNTCVQKCKNAIAACS